MSDQVRMSSTAPQKVARAVLCALVLLCSGSVAAVAEGPTPATQADSTLGIDAASLEKALVPAGDSETTAGDSEIILVEDADALLIEEPSGADATEQTLPHNLSPWGMFMGADIVVKLVMLSLAFASLLTWTIWATKTLEISRAKARLAKANARIAKMGSLVDAMKAIANAKNDVGNLLVAADWEVRQSLSDTFDKEGVKERVISHLERLEAGSARRMSFGTGVLATIGSTAPFVGLFGTVWGIMNAFIGISEAQTTNLAVVAPGIAEALLATALGLVAAIPAVMIYNHFSRQLAAYRAELSDVSAIIFRLVSRDLDRGRADLFNAAE